MVCWKEASAAFLLDGEAAVEALREEEGGVLVKVSALGVGIPGVSASEAAAAAPSSLNMLSNWACSSGWLRVSCSRKDGFAIVVAYRVIHVAEKISHAGL